MAGPVEPLLKAVNLSVAIGGETIVREVSFDLMPGSWFGLVGVNGSGKTTLMRALAGRLPVDEGDLFIGAEDLTEEDAARAGMIGFAPAPESLPGLLRGAELLELLGDARHADPKAPEGVYEALGVGRLANRRIGEMSSGMRQRLAIFSAFIGEPAIVLLDEPFNWLDPVAAFDFKAALAEMTKAGLSVITALHDVATLATRADAGLLLDNGKVLKTFDKAALAKGAADLAGFELEIYKLFSREG
jgi:ABC-type multidrug transport system ATPase subunit